MYLFVGLALLSVAALIHFAAFSVQGALFVVGAVAVVLGLLLDRPRI